MRTILALLLLVTTVSCQTRPRGAGDSALRDIDAFVANVVRTIPEVPSIGIAIVHDGQRHARAFGYADRDRQVPATAQTGYYIGSNTKAFTGLAAAILAERGRIDLDAPLSTYLPEVKFNAPIDAKKVTLRLLLSHSAAIENNPVVFRTAFSGDHTSANLLQILNHTRPRTEGFRYDNLGYVIAGLALERVTGRTWQQLHDDLLFEPLNMKRTTALMSVAQRAALAQPYDLDNKGELELLSYRKNDQMMHAAGGTVTTPEDLTRWLEAQLTGTAGTRPAISPTAIAETQRQQAAVVPRGAFAGRGYGFGWYQGTHDGDAIVYHGGGFEGWRSLFSLMPQKKIGVAVATNSGVSNPVTQLITSYAYDRLLGKSTDYTAKLAKVRADLDVRKSETAADTAQRAQRQSQLRHEPAAYAGRYENALYGTMEIEQRDGKLHASIGSMRAELEPYTEPETARVELDPAAGEVLRFVFSNDAAADALRYRDEVFTRRP